MDPLDWALLWCWRDENDCWLYVRALDSCGYAQVHYPKGSPVKSRVLHCAVWEREHGPIPEGLEIDHKCEVRNCCNPEHLQLLTRGENIKKSSAWHHLVTPEARAATGERNKRRPPRLGTGKK